MKNDKSVETTPDNLSALPAQDILTATELRMPILELAKQLNSQAEYAPGSGIDLRHPVITFNNFSLESMFSYLSSHANVQNIDISIAKDSGSVMMIMYEKSGNRAISKPNLFCAVMEAFKPCLGEAKAYRKEREHKWAELLADMPSANE